MPGKGRKAGKENRVCAARLREWIRTAGAALRGWEQGQSRREGVEVEEDQNARPAHRHGHQGPRHTLSTALNSSLLRSVFVAPGVHRYRLKQLPTRTPRLH